MGPGLGTIVLVSNCGNRDPFLGLVVKITRRRLDRTCTSPVTYWHIRTIEGRVERWVNVRLTPIDVAWLAEHLPWYTR